ncbi:MAG: hypothetical protein HY907_15745 [Deltaproteobacteria bacterium]|nr:hypothetical protein [Deltaproteobacteria bacterium]
MAREATTDATPLRLMEIGPGATRSLRLRLMEIRRNDKRPTDFFLRLSIECVRHGVTYLVHARGEFGGTPPRRASLTVVAGRMSAEPPLRLVEDGAPVEAQFTLVLDPATEWVTLWVATEGEPAVPAQLAGQLLLRQPEDARPPEALETARLPSLKFVMRQSLMHAFRQAPSEALVALGALMRSEEPREKYALLRSLVESGADVRLVEAGVRDLAAAEQIVRGFPPVDFSRLAPERLLDASVIVLHPAAPLPLVRQAFATAFERQYMAGSPEEAGRWRDLVKAGAVVICRKDRSMLDEGFAVATGIASDPARQALFKSLVEWAWSRATPSVRPLAGPVETYLKRVTGKVAADADAAAVEVMAHYDLVSATV